MSEATKDQIKGAFGTVKEYEPGARRGARARLLTLLAIIGPGLIVMVGDNDAGGVSTYAQAGQNFGYTLLWTLPLLIPVLIVNQEMVVRLGAVTGIGHGRLIRERIGRRWGNVSISSILLLNFLIIVTEFIGISLSMEYFGVSAFVSVPIAVVALFGVTATGSFQRWERFMMLFVAVNLVMIPLVTARPRRHALALSRPRGAGHPRRHVLGRGPAHHLDHRHHRRAVAAVLPAEQHRRQEDLAALDELRAHRHDPRFVHRGRHRGAVDGHHRGRSVAPRRNERLRQRAHASPTASRSSSGTAPATSSPSSC